MWICFCVYACVALLTPGSVFNGQVPSPLDKSFLEFLETNDNVFRIMHAYVAVLLIFPQWMYKYIPIFNKYNKYVYQRGEVIKKWVMGWYEHRAYIIFHQRLAELLPLANWVNGLPNLTIMPMKRQWGSCSTSGRILLNPHLVKAPKECIDYVLLHELCHIAEHNHSERFWRLLTKVMPDWKVNKAKLDEMAELYLNE